MGLELFKNHFILESPHENNNKKKNKSRTMSIVHFAVHHKEIENHIEQVHFIFYVHNFLVVPCTYGSLYILLL